MVEKAHGRYLLSHSTCPKGWHQDPPKFDDNIEEKSKVKTPLQSIGQPTDGWERDERASGLCEVHVAPEALRRHVEMTILHSQI